MEISLLRKGRSGRVDAFFKILVCLTKQKRDPSNWDHELIFEQEDGIFDALSKRVLDAVQIDVTASKKDCSQVSESYTFTVKYKDSAVEGLTFESTAGQSDGQDSVHERFVTLLHQIGDAARYFRNRLPRKLKTKDQKCNNYLTH